MATRETRRFHIPYPGLNDQSNWDAKFVSMITQVDSNLFGLLEHQQLTFQGLPTVTNNAGTHALDQVGDLVIISRTFGCTITVAAASVALVPQEIIGIEVPSGITANAVATWDVTDLAAVDVDFLALGYVDPTYNIYWWNGAVLAVGDTARLFSHITGGTLAWLSGIGNPNGVVVAVAGTRYHDTAANIIYTNTDSVSTWIL